MPKSRVTAERWTQVEALFHRAAECAPEHRAALLDDYCSSDAELRRQVEALLSFDENAGDSVQAAVRDALEDVGFPLTRETISHYQTLDGLGSGGMGLVYRAEDIRLGRRVTEGAGLQLRMKVSAAMVVPTATTDRCDHWIIMISEVGFYALACAAATAAFAYRFRGCTRASNNYRAARNNPTDVHGFRGGGTKCRWHTPEGRHGVDDER